MDQTARNTFAEPARSLPSYGRLAGKVCLVTGATSGIGRATALQMARDGAAAIVISGRRRALGESVAAELRTLGTDHLFVEGDMKDEASAAKLVDSTLRHFGRLDAAFNNAGIVESRAPLAQQTDAAYAQVFGTNVAGLFHAMRHQIQAMIANGGGAIVNNTSVSGFRNPHPGFALYAASKAAANSLTRSASIEYAAQGVRINAIAPGRVVTDLLRETGVDVTRLAQDVPLRRLGRPKKSPPPSPGCSPTKPATS
jgi:NAD(P)-dependent dehydrogenase (short-subunit alcohol dehydrogenase family)